MSYYEGFKKVLLAEPHAILGKKGLTDEFIQHITTLLNRYKIIKIKALKSVANKRNIKSIAEQITISTNSNLLDIRGFKFIISKYPIKKKQN